MEDQHTKPPEPQYEYETIDGSRLRIYRAAPRDGAGRSRWRIDETREGRSRTLAIADFAEERRVHAHALRSRAVRAALARLAHDITAATMALRTRIGRGRGPRRAPPAVLAVTRLP
jgi:hypothetical protein